MSSSKSKQHKNNNEIVSLVMFTGLVLFSLSIFKLSSGYAIEIIQKMCFGLLGFVAYLLPFLFLYFFFASLISKRSITKYLSLFALISLISALISTFSYNVNVSILDSFVTGYENDLLYKSGGIIGYLISTTLVFSIGKIGSIVLIIGLTIAVIIYITGFSLNRILQKTAKLFRTFLSKIKTNKKHHLEKTHNKKDTIIDISKPLKMEVNNNEMSDRDFVIKDYLKTQEKIKIARPEEMFQDKPVALHVVREAKPLNSGEYILPSFDVLDIKPYNDVTNESDDIKSNALKLEETLRNFGIGSQVVSVERGPSITRFELRIEPGIKVSRITNLADDIALSLASSSVRIEAPIKGKSAVGIEVPNVTASSVSIRDVVEGEAFRKASSKLSMAIGKSVTGEDIVEDLAKMPHILIAGATGSGKSVCINTMIISILFKAKPDEVKLLLIDPKMVELSIYNGIPHLIMPVVTDPKKASKALTWVLNEMQRRYSVFSEKHVKDIHRFNELKDKECYMPQVVVVIDELADLMMTSPKEIEDLICRIAQMARAAGIHLIVATQRPSVDVITGLIKANIPTRISFAVASAVDSRTILDSSGAEKLLGRGDSLYSSQSKPGFERVQCAFTSEREVERMVNYIKYQQVFSSNDLVKLDAIVTDDKGELDDLYDEALNVIRDAGNASVLLLQRKLKIGYSRAARIIDQLEFQGVISGHEGSKPRKLLMSGDMNESDN